MVYKPVFISVPIKFIALKVIEICDYGDEVGPAY